MSNRPDKPAFQAGTIVTTLGGIKIATRDQLSAILQRHLMGDWDTGDATANKRALKHGGDRVMSEYEVEGKTLWVITEASRESTAVLTPGECYSTICMKGRT